MSNKSVAVVIPCFNYEAVITRAVRSVITQIRPGFELFVIDDGSTDQSLSVLRDLESNLRGGLRVFTQVNAGPSVTRNRALKISTADYFVFLDADDELAPNALSIIEASLKSSPSADLLIGEHLAVSSDGSRKHHKNHALAPIKRGRVIDYALKKKLSLVNGACVMSRRIFVKGIYPEHFRGGEDIPVFIQALANVEAKLIPEVILIHHKHRTSLRHNFEIASQVGERLISEIFDTGRLPQGYQDLRRSYTARRFLSLFRTALNAGEKKHARRFFWKACKFDIVTIVLGGYIFKFIRSFFPR